MGPLTILGPLDLVCPVRAAMVKFRILGPPSLWGPGGDFKQPPLRSSTVLGWSQDLCITRIHLEDKITVQWNLKNKISLLHQLSTLVFWYLHRYLFFSEVHNKNFFWFHFEDSQQTYISVISNFTIFWKYFYLLHINDVNLFMQLSWYKDKNYLLKWEGEFLEHGQPFMVVNRHSIIKDHEPHS